MQDIILSRPDYKGELCVHWVIDDRPPLSYQEIGVIEPTVEELAIECKSVVSGWEYFEKRRLAQEHWEKEQAGEILVPEQEIKNDYFERQEAALKARRAVLDYQKLSDIRLFDDWHEKEMPEFVEVCRDIWTHAIQQMKLASSSKQQKLSVLRECVENFNKVHNLKFIDTEEREEICSALEDLAFVAGLPDQLISDKIDEWRKW